MKIAGLETILLSIPFKDGSEGTGIMPTKWETLEFTLVKIETDTGLTGWGEGFGYSCSRATAAIIERNIAPLLIGREITSPPEMCAEIQRKMVLQGRYGISIFALSGVDIALWDILGKSEGAGIAELSGRVKRKSVQTYASLVRYGNEQAARFTEKALGDGFSYIKLHEITMPPIRMCREAIGGDAKMVVDVNCNWSEKYTREVIPELLELDTFWLEEPVFPPEDFPLLASLRKTGMPIAAGENACTAHQFALMLREEAVDYAQPSITKVGGISEYLQIRDLCERNRTTLMPHSPYFGPGYLASLQMAALGSRDELFEYLYIDPEAWLYAEMPLPENGSIEIPTGPGLGLDPDAEAIEKYRVR